MSNNGGSAFPWCGDLNECPAINLGMSLRDYFAAKAMQGQINNPLTIGNEESRKLMAKRAYEMADLMLIAGSK
jgi:hypothetical protein